MANAFKCDRCGGFYEDKPFRISIIHNNAREREICYTCAMKLSDFLGGAELAEITLDEQDNGQCDDNESVEGEATYEIKPLIYDSYCGHDCETWYRCPYCDGSIGSWTLYHQNRDGEKQHCVHCGKEVYVKHN